MYVSHAPHPAPFGDVTARWLRFSETDRDRHARRLVGVPVAEAGICQPARDGADRYPQLVAHARAGDAVALGWLATVHGPLLVARGRPLLERDPSEWGSVCLALLHDTIAAVDLADGVWLRRRVQQRLGERLWRIVRRRLSRERHETATDPTMLRTSSDASGDRDGRDGQQDLSIQLDRVLGQLDAPTREAFLALADRRPLHEVAARHRLSHAAVKQRVARARPRLQHQLTRYRRAVRS